MSEQWGLPDEVENTAIREKRAADDRLHRAETGAMETDAVVSRMEKAMREIRRMHQKNHYRDILLPILQGSHRHG